MAIEHPFPRSGRPASTSDAGDAVARARGGEVDAFGEVVREHGGRVYALCLRMCGNRERARELAHDALVRAWERMDSFRGDAAFSTWLHRLTVNVVLEATRAERRREARVTTADEPEVLEGVPDGRGDVHARMDLERAIASLPPSARTVFVLHAVEGYRHEEIAAQMQLAEGTVRAHLHRARQLLMKVLRP